MSLVRRYDKEKTVLTSLDPLDSVVSWVEGLTSARRVESLLKSHHHLEGPLTIEDRSRTVANLIGMTCRYLEQAAKGPKDISFLPLYYALLNLSKAYVAIGPYGHELCKNRYHGASYDVDQNKGNLDDDCVELHKKGTIPLLYRTLTGQAVLPGKGQSVSIRMENVYPYIRDIQAEYEEAGGKDLLMRFRVERQSKSGKVRFIARYIPGSTESEIKEHEQFKSLDIKKLQPFKGFERDAQKTSILASSWYDKDDTPALDDCLRRALIYSSLQHNQQVDYVPLSDHELLLPEELPLIIAFFHMSMVVRYNPDALQELSNSQFWPVLLELRRQGVYRFLLLFYSFATQCCWQIAPG